jgi:hypothetical protein
MKNIILNTITKWGRYFALQIDSEDRVSEHRADGLAIGRP